MTNESRRCDSLFALSFTLFFLTMNSRNYAQLLFTAVRETLETMAFAEVVPFSIRVGDEEFNREDGLDDFILTDQPEEAGPATDGGDSWGTATPATPAPADDAWGTPAATNEENADFGKVEAWEEAAPREIPESDDEWGASGFMLPSGIDPWGEAAPQPGNEVAGLSMKADDINFQKLVDNQEQWCWSCMRVNSPDIHAIWFIVSQELAMELARNMYAGEELTLNSPLIRDLVAELTNVLGGRMMLLLENLGGKFTLTVPEIGFGMPEIPENQTLETVLCRVLVDGEYPVIASLSFNPGRENN